MTIGHAQARRAHLAGVVTARLVMGLVLLAALGAGAIAWAATTRPADPLNRYPGFGFESSGVSRIHVGGAAVFASYLFGDTAKSRATVTGVILPHILGVRLHVYAVTGSPQGGIVGPLARTDDAHEVRASQLHRIVGRSLRPAPAEFRPRRWILTIALVAAPLTQGCFRITGVGIRYRVGDSTFTKTMDSPVSVATGHRFCAG